MDRIAWDTRPPDQQGTLVSQVEQLATERVAWFCSVADSMRQRGVAARKAQNRIWMIIIVLNALIALLNVASLLPPVDQYVATWVIPFVTVFLSVIISTVGLLRDAKKHGQVAALCDEFYDELMGTEEEYKTKYTDGVLANRGCYEEFLQLNELFHWLGQAKHKMSLKITKEFAAIGEKREPQHVPTLSPD